MKNIKYLLQVCLVLCLIITVGCKKKVTTTVYNQGTPNEYVVVTTTYYCDVEHQWLNGEVTNHTLEEVLASYNFSDEEINLYNMYLEQINKMLDGG